MNKELIVTSEDIELLKEMKDNCLKSDVYDDEKRLLKSNAITKVLYQSLKRQKEELRSWLKEMLDNEDDIFSVVRVKDVLSKLEELEGVNDED